MIFVFSRKLLTNQIFVEKDFICQSNLMFSFLVTQIFVGMLQHSFDMGVIAAVSIISTALVWLDRIGSWGDGTGFRA